MDAVSTQASQTVEFKGHLIDSLTLSKVADQILLRGAQYRLNDVRIGSARKDISSVSMTLFAESREKLAELLEDMKAYGAQPAGDVNVELMPAPANGVVPEEAFCVKLPEKVHYNGQWLDLHAGESLAIVIDPERNEARLVKVDEVRQGAQVVSGTQGIEW